MDGCVLCQPGDFTVVHGEDWSIRLNEDQHFLGRCYFALNRHETDVTKITPAEVLSLWELFTTTRKCLDALFSPDHYNYVFLMNVTPHVHAHIIPRYADIRMFSGEIFVDGRLGEHYDTGNPHVPPKMVLDELRDTMARELSK
jgi:diadenosine tetraphosphate (Ap4A) HIT family hydrolase